MLAPRPVDPKTKRAKYARAYEGAYQPRTHACEGGDECITVERSSTYARLTPNLFVIVGAVLAEDAPPSLQKVRAVLPDAFIKFSPIRGDPGGYGATSQCIDWDLIVLARTKRFEEAEAIAKAISEATGIRYAARKPPATTDDAYDGRKAPFPNISVEAENAYGDGDDSPYFLVIGGEFGASGKATPALFKRYKRSVPNAFRMKRARHVCGA